MKKLLIAAVLVTVPAVSFGNTGINCEAVADFSRTVMEGRQYGTLMRKITIELAGQRIPVTVTECWPAHEGGLYEPPADEYFEWKFDNEHDQMMAMVDEFLLKDVIEEKISKELASEEDYEP